MGEIHYANTDLDLVAPRDLTPLTDALNALSIYTLNLGQGNDGRWYSTLEVNSGELETDPERTIRAMLDAIEALDGEAKQLWAECSKREFNIGYDCGDEPWAFNQGLSNATLQRMAAMGATLRITIYPERPPRQLAADQS